MRPITALGARARPLAQCAAWRDAGRPLAVAVNVSPTNLLDAGFVDLVRAPARDVTACPPTPWSWRSPRPASSRSSRRRDG